ncbi:MAG: hypothetical protein RIR97_2036 [Pseudomonadota bacterium]
MTGFALYSANDFRRRALSQTGLPVDVASRDHGEHVMNPHVSDVLDGMTLRDAAVLIPVVDDGVNGRMIFTQRTAHLRQHSGQIAFPGGGIDDTDQSPEHAALREAEEEIGLDRRYVETVARLPDYATLTGFRIKPVLAIVKPGYTLTANPSEVADIFDVPLSFLMNAQNHTIDSRVWKDSPLWNDRPHFYYTMPYGDRLIWGITAGIVRMAYERLYR